MEEFTQYHGGDAMAYRLYTSGLWIFNQLQGIRTTRDYYRTLDSEAVSPIDFARGHLGLACFKFKQMISDTESSQRNQEKLSVDAILTYETQRTIGGISAAPAFVMEHLLDSLRGPLFEIFREPQNVSHITQRITAKEKIPLFDFVQHESRLSEFHEGLSNLWQSLLWGFADYFFQDGKSIVSIVNDGDQKRRAVAEYRRSHHAAEKAGHLIADLQNEFHQHVIQATARNRKYLAPILNPKKSRLGIILFDELHGEIADYAKYAIGAEHYFVEDHLRPLLDIPQKSLANLPLKAVLEIWTVLAIFGRQIYDQLKQQKNPESFENLKDFSPEFDYQELVDELSKLSGRQTTDIEVILQLLTFTAKSRRDDIWIQPLVKLDISVFISLPAILTANVYRNVEEWLRLCGGNDDGLRGSLLEQDLIPLLVQSEERNSILSKSLNWTTPSLHFYGEDRTFEDIDLSFCIGQTIVVIEARSRRRPQTPVDYHNDLHDANGLFHKASQAKRKAAYIQKNLKSFISAHYPNLLGHLDSVKIFPIVVSDGHFYVGTVLEEIPIMDISSLQHYLRDGKARFLGIAGLEVGHKYEVHWYETADEAERAFPLYATMPTVAQITSKFMKTNLRPLMHPNGQKSGDFIQEWLPYEPSELELINHLNQLAIGKLITLF